MDCRIYLNKNVGKKVLLNWIKELFAVDTDSNYIELDSTEIYIAKNIDFDELRSNIFPDGFLFFPYIVELNSTSNQEEDLVMIVNRILLFFWQQKISAIASYDNEHLLVESGGYNNKNVPWG